MTMPDHGAEVPPEDAFEQQLPVTAGQEEDEQAAELPVSETPVEADPADLAEQNRVVELDEDEYR